MGTVLGLLCVVLFLLLVLLVRVFMLVLVLMLVPVLQPGRWGVGPPSIDMFQTLH